jgi:ssRNA-specific RNase YbeY (16S rRNA maturation enzyme)
MRRAMNKENRIEDLTVYITTDSEIRLLNRKFHATNSATDVLSFPSYDSAYLGDIVISRRPRAGRALAGA